MPTVTRDADESKVDMDALARLEALQKRQMVEMFGFDYDQEEEERAARRQLLEEEREQKRKDKLMRAKTQQQQDESSKKKARKKNKSAAVSSTPQGTKGHVGRPTGQGKGTVEWFGSEFRMPGPVESSSGPDSGAIKAPLKSAEFMARKQKKSNYGAESFGKGDGDFISAARIVEELGASTFVGKEKKAWEQKKLKELGAKAPKNEKKPIFILKGMRAKAKDRLAKQKVRDQESGMAVKKAKKKGKAVSIMSHNTSGVLKVNPKVKTDKKSVGGLLKSLGRTNKSKAR